MIEKVMATIWSPCKKLINARKDKGLAFLLGLLNLAGVAGLEPATFHINPEIKSLEDLETWVTLDYFWVEGYQHHDPIRYPFSV
ncbi:exported hypothetical protein [Vibrio aestuarianus]|nr:exported hypothetical protein [Vibrio aestuarianus]